MELTARSHYKNRDVVKHYSNMTLLKAFESKSKGIGQLAKQDEEKAIKCITNLFKGTALYFDSALTDNQAEIIADEILAKYEYRSLKLEDIVAICIRLKESEIYKITPARIMREIRKYSLEREKVAINKSIGVSDNNKTSINLNIEQRIKKHYNSLPNVNKLAQKRNSVSKRFK